MGLTRLPRRVPPPKIKPCSRPVQFANVTQVMLNVSAVPFRRPTFRRRTSNSTWTAAAIAPDQVVEQVNGFHDLWFTPKLTTNESNALSIIQPTGHLPTPLDGGFIPTVL